VKAPAQALLLFAALACSRAAPGQDRVNARDFGARCDGMTDDTPSLATAAAAANASGRSLYLPAGTCLIRASASGALFKLVAPHVWLKGEGRGITVLRLTGTVALSGELDVVALAGETQGVEGITFAYDAALSGSFAMIWIAINPGGFDTTVRDCEFSGGYGGNTAGGAAVTSYAPLTGVSRIKTKLGSPVAPGPNVVTPGGGTGMAGIYIGKRLVIGAGHTSDDIAEDVVVTARTASSFSAVFAHSHPGTDTIGDRSYNTQRVLVENNYIHDCFACSGLLLNSGGSVVRGNKIVNIGLNNFQHGIYVQSGNNRIVDNWIEGVSGYGIHGHKAVPQEDSSGDLYEGNTIVNYGRQCIIADSIVSDGANPEVPRGASLNRYVTIANNTCRILKGAGSSNLSQGIGVQIGGNNSADTGGALIVNNTLEDACGTTPNCSWISTGSFYSDTVNGNHLRILTGGARGQIGINTNGGTNVSVMGNVIENWSVSGAALYLASNIAAIGNNIAGAAGGGPMVAINGHDVVFCNNMVVQSGGIGVVAPALSNSVQICGNHLTGPPGTAVLDLNQMQTGSIHDNSIVGGYVKVPASGANLQIYNNDGEFRWTTLAPSNSVIMSRGMGRLMNFPTAANPLVAGLAVANDGNGNILTAPAGGAAFQGFVLQDKSSAVGSAYIVGQESAEFDFAQTDSAWTAGHFGILSANSDGKIHDYGTVPPPPNYSFVQFLDSGSGAGSARVLLVRLATANQTQNSKKIPAP
jgi:hypothetical protein